MAFYNTEPLRRSTFLLPAVALAWIVMTQTSGIPAFWREVVVYAVGASMFGLSGAHMWRLHRTGDNWGFAVLAGLLFAHVFTSGGYPYIHTTVHAPYGFVIVSLLSPSLGMALMVTALIGEQRTLRNEINARIAAETAQQQSRVLIDALLSHTPAGIVVFEGDSGNCVLANQAIADMVGASTDVLKTQNFRQLNSWREAGLDRLAEAVLVDGDTRYEETRHTCCSWARILPNVRRRRKKLIFSPIMTR